MDKDKTIFGREDILSRIHTHESPIHISDIIGMEEKYVNDILINNYRSANVISKDGVDVSNKHSSFGIVITRVNLVIVNGKVASFTKG